ncbi:RsmD family RNA methyltransferase [Ferrimicrobium sp.]|uniref:RsmD family RNA methyltransferase n=1 Tax=Ferrimicrobium sp. TaxID=2926050 RepID=UPI00260A8056|nr:RsmD family RNA methyltransferase [Ferrimicrobium sp.]
MVRIVAGTLGGRRLKLRVPAGVRPTTERLREALFSILESMMALEGTSWLDLFGGSGAVGFEAISRGASSVVYNDCNASLADQVRKQALVLGITDRMRWHAVEALGCLDRLRDDEFTIVFLDPPYRYTGFEELGRRLPSARFVVVESTSEVTLGPRWRVCWWRRYGDTRLGLFEPVEHEGQEVR